MMLFVALKHMRSMILPKEARALCPARCAPLFHESNTKKYVAHLGLMRRSAGFMQHGYSGNNSHPRVTIPLHELCTGNCFTALPQHSLGHAISENLLRLASHFLLCSLLRYLYHQ